MHSRPAADHTVFGQLADALAADWALKARPNQLAPAGDWWSIWLVMSGRGWGKTRTASEWVRSQYLAGCGRIALVGATAADTRDVMIEGESGIMATSPKHDRPYYEPSKRRLTWNNGAMATAYSADEPERLRGPQHDAASLDEIATWRYPDAFDQLMFGLRIGKRPRAIITTTPRPTKLVRDLVAREGKDVVLTRGRTSENEANLAPIFLSQIVGLYQGTRLGRQELDGELLEDVQGALWSRAMIEAGRVAAGPELKRIVVAIDPAAKSTEGSDETGIVVAGLGHDDHAYVLEDLTGRLAPEAWARRAVNAYYRHQADRIVYEANQGGDMCAHTLRMVDASVPLRGVHASRGKAIRAEPVSALYEQARVHHVGTYPELEDQMCGFTADFDRSSAGYSPDRLDALVWAISELSVKAPAPQPVFGRYSRSSPGWNGARMVGGQSKRSKFDGLITDPADPYFGGYATSMK